MDSTTKETRAAGAALDMGCLTNTNWLLGEMILARAQARRNGTQVVAWNRPKRRRDRALREQLTLHLGQFHGRRTCLVVVGDVVDPGAHGIPMHQPGIVGLQQFGRRTHIPNSRIEP